MNDVAIGKVEQGSDAKAAPASDIGYFEATAVAGDQCPEKWIRG